MKLKTKARYAIRSMVEIAHSSVGGKPVSLEQVALKTGISRRYLEQLTRQLREAALLRSVRGRKGGYLLALPAADITIGHIVEAVIGPINIVECVPRPELCLIADTCECRMIYESINDRIVRAMNAHSLADLARGVWLEKVGPGISVASPPDSPESTEGDVVLPVGPCGSPCANS